MEIRSTDTTTFIITPTTILSIGEVKQESEVIKCFISSEYVFDIYQLADQVEQSSFARCIFSDKERGLILFTKNPIYSKSEVLKNCIAFIKETDRVQKHKPLLKRKTA